MQTALTIVCGKGSTYISNLLLNAGANPNITDGEGFTCIHHAANGGCSKKVFETLIKHGADVNATNKNNRTALMIACNMGNVDAIDVILNAGGNPNIADDDGGSCIQYAVDAGCSKTVLKTLINHGADVNVTNKNNTTALLLAIKKGNMDTIYVLLKAGANPHIANDNGFACIYCAVFENCSQDVLETIITHGADVNATDKNNETALMVACRKGNINTINVLLNAGANPNFADDSGYTCIHDVVDGYGSKDVLETIISHGADVNAVNTANLTALMITCTK